MLCTILVDINSTLHLPKGVVSTPAPNMENNAML